MQLQTKKTTLTSIYFTFFVDNLSWAIVFPIFAPYFLNPQNSILPASLSAGSRAVVLSFFLMAFSLGQFLGAPLIGDYADKHGRKKALAMGVFFTLIGLSLSAWSMQVGSLFLLFVSRLITGIFASTTSVCLSCASDLSEDEAEKVKNFGSLSTVAGMAFIVGAFMGGKLSDASINSSFSPNLPLWLSAALSALSFFSILFGFRETSTINPVAKFHFFEAFQNIKIALRTEKIKRKYTIYFLFLFAWTILFQFIPVLVVERFFFTNSNLGDLALFMGACWAIGSGYINRKWIQIWKSVYILECCLIGFTILCGLIVVPTHVYSLLIILGLSVMLGGVAWPICTSLISGAAPREIQGKILGMSQSVQSLAMTLGALVGGSLFHFSLVFPFLLAAGMGGIAVFLYYFTLKYQ